MDYKMKLKKSFSVFTFVVSMALVTAQAFAIDQASTLTALRLSNTITGGTMPATDPIFAQMVTKIQAGDLKGAAMTAAKSKYFANYLAKRLAFQMQSPALDATVTADNDSTAFLIAHFTGAGGEPPSISTIFSENQTYLVKIMVSGAPMTVHVNEVAGASGFTVSPSQIDWSTQLVQGGPQQAVTEASVTPPVTSTVYTAVPSEHVGGFITASTSVKPNAASLDLSFAQYGALLGTNLRMNEAIWEVATGLSLVDFEDTTYASTNLMQAEAVPRFVPENNPNFFIGQGQSACISCHGGGLSAMKHGYATVADVFDYDENAGFVFSDPAVATTSERKSLGSNSNTRSATLACNLKKTPTIACNADSPGVDASQTWDLSSWQQTGMLNVMGWTGPITGQGLNSLGVALGKASIVYQFLTERIIKEICPVGYFTANDVTNIANAANPYAIVPGTDDIATIVALVASNSSCQ